MTKDYFQKVKWRHSEEILFSPPSNNDIIISCTLLAIDFEQELFKLIPFDIETYEEVPFWCRIEYCNRPLKLKKVN